MVAGMSNFGGRCPLMTENEAYKGECVTGAMLLLSVVKGKRTGFYYYFVCISLKIHPVKNHYIYPQLMNETSDL